MEQDKNNVRKMLRKCANEKEMKEYLEICVKRKDRMIC